MLAVNRNADIAWFEGDGNVGEEITNTKYTGYTVWNRNPGYTLTESKPDEAR